MPAGKPWAPIKGKRARFTKLNSSLASLVGSASTGVTSGFISAKVTPQYDDGDTYQQKNANGDYCVNEKSDPVMTGADLEIAFCGVDADYLAMLSGMATVVDFEAAAVGVRLGGGVPTIGGNAMELWSGIARNGAMWGYFLVPAMGPGKVSEWSIENGLANFTLTCSTKEGVGWGQGPTSYTVVGTGAQGATPGRITTAMAYNDYVHLQSTNVAPPAVTAGLVALS